MNKVIALDPGRTTGIAISEGKEIDSFELRYEDGLQNIFNTLSFASVLPNDMEEFHLVYEDFYFRQGLTNIDYYPLQVIGVINYFSEVKNITPVAQNPSLKGFWLYNKAAKLKKIGLYKPGKPHAMDALSHALYYKTFKLKDKYWIERVHEDAKTG